MIHHGSEGGLGPGKYEVGKCQIVVATQTNNPVVLHCIREPKHGASSHLICHGLCAAANIGTEPFNGFVEFVMKPYFSWLPGSLVAWAAIHDVIEFVGGILLAAGFLTRYAAAALSGTMVSPCYLAGVPVFVGRRLMTS